MIVNLGVQRLLEYGLTEYEARSYLALLAAGAGTARELASVSRVPRTKIYGVLDELQAKGLARPVEGRPRRFEAVPVEDYLERFAGEVRARLARLGEERAALAREFPAPPSRRERAGAFHVVKGRRNVVGRVQEMLARARGSVLVAGSASLPARLLLTLDDVEQAAKRGVRLRLLCPLAPANEAAVRQLRGLVEVRGARAPSSGSGTVVVDGRESLLCHFVPDDDHPLKGDDVGIWSDDAAIVADLARTLEGQWDQGLAGGANGHGAVAPAGLALGAVEERPRRAAGA